MIQQYYSHKTTKKRDNQMSEYLEKLIQKQKEQKELEEIRDLQEQHIRYENTNYYEVTEHKDTDVLYTGLRDIKMTDDETWYLIFDINEILKLYIPKNERQREDFMFLRSLKRQIAKDSRISEKQIKWYENIKEYVNV